MMTWGGVEVDADYRMEMEMGMGWEDGMERLTNAFPSV